MEIVSMYNLPPQEPILDTVYRALLTGNDQLLEESFSQQPEKLLSLRLINSTEDLGGIEMPIPVTKLNNGTPWITSLFKGPRYFFISKGIAEQKLVTGSKITHAKIDWSYSFDSNVADKMKAYVELNDKLQDSDKKRVIQLLEFKRDLDLQTDMVPFIFENIRFYRDESQWKRVFNTVKAFKKLDYIDWDAFEKDPNHPKFLTNEQHIIESSRSDLEYFEQDSVVKDIENKKLFSHAILLELAYLWLTSPNDKISIMRNLIYFCIYELGKFPKHELVIIYQFLCSPKNFPFFGPIVDVSKSIIQRLSGMAWDLTHFRTLETFATKSNNDSFYLPFFVSFDGKFSDLISRNHIDFLAMDTEEERVLSATESEILFHKDLPDFLTPELNNMMSQKEIDKRRAHTPNWNKLKKTIDNRQILVSDLADKERRP